MSEFYFDYKCIDADDPSGGDKALDFMLCQNCPNGGRGVQVYIPPELYKDFDKAGLSFAPDGAALSAVTSSECNTETYSLSRDDPHGVARTNSIYITSDDLSGVGVIRLVKEGGEKEKTFCFAVNFARKDVISYSILESKNGITVRVLYPLIKKSIELELLRKRGSKPLTVLDGRSADNYLANGNGLPQRVYLEATGRKDGSVTRELDAEHTDSYDFRAVFADPDDSKHYLLIDESDFTIEDQSRRKKALVEKAVDVAREKRNTKRRGTRALDIVTLGARNSGKSTFIASVYGMRRENDKLVTEPDVLERIARTFDRSCRKAPPKTRCVRELPLDIEWYAKNIYNKKPTDERAIATRARERYLLNAGDPLVIDKNNEVNTSYMTRYPITFTLGRMGDLCLFDTVNGGLGKDTVFECADCFVVTVDGAKPTATALADLKKALDGISEQAKRYSSVHSGASVPLDEYPLAVVLTKHDLHLKDRQSGDGARFLQCFDDNCHVVREDMRSLYPKTGVFRGSVLERHIDSSSYEIEHYFRAFEPNIIDEIVARFKTVRFFTCSALGGDGCVGVKGNDRFIKYAPNPLRVELPLIWLMYKKGMIK